MQGVYRQFCYQSAHIQPKTKQTNKYQNVLNKTHHSIKTRVERKALIQIRKINYKTPLTQLSDKGQGTRTQIYGEKMDEHGQKIKKIKGVRRHTFYATDPKDVKDKIQKPSNSIILYQRTKPATITQYTMYLRQFNKTKMRGKIKDKSSKTSEHRESIENQRQQPINLRKVKNLHETKLPVLINGEQNPFLHLLKKFRFQNLKTAVVREGSESPFLRDPMIQRGNKQRSFTSFKAVKHELSQMEQEGNKIPFYHKTQLRQNRNEKTIEKITPWQIADQLQFFG